MEEITIFFQETCPVCRRVRHEVLQHPDLIKKMKVKEIDINANNGSPEVQWYKWFCRTHLGAEVVPVLRLKNHILLVPKIKGTIEEEVLAAGAEKLTKELARLRKMVSEVIAERAPPIPYATHEQWRQAYVVPKAV